ncbi:hypothetical protein TRIUR3_30191 [Triticum urartu]|uniref:ubiquitinyl hydrolase 1 n=1 Tax=Triticum urartu TaxID=4572 RepID=M7Z6G9_TRIUA|nr:hypothetical protein TRIUR3_30191 [Triticum urartu]
MRWWQDAGAALDGTQPGGGQRVDRMDRPWGRRLTGRGGVCLLAVWKKQVQNFGEPFFMVIREDQTLSSIKECLQKKLKVSDEDFSKWKFAYISLGCPDYFEDSDTVATRFQINMYGAWEQYLGLEHPDTAPRKAHSANQDWLLKLMTEPEFSLLLPQLERSKAIVDKAKLKSATSVEDMH